MHMIKPKARPNLKIPNFFDEAIRTIIFVIIVTVLFDMAIPRSLVDGRSMEPSFYDGERLIVSRLNYLLTTPKRGDVIVFNSLTKPDTEMLIKRVIGEPGDTIEFRQSEVYVNGERLQEDYINECISSCYSTEIWTVPEDAYFVMGDNRDHSSDSRVFGVVPIQSIVGRVVFRYWRMDGIGLLPFPDYSE